MYSKVGKLWTIILSVHLAAMAAMTGYSIVKIIILLFIEHKMYRISELTFQKKYFEFQKKKKYMI